MCGIVSVVWEEVNVWYCVGSLEGSEYLVLCR